MGHWEQISRDNRTERLRLSHLSRWRRLAVIALLFLVAGLLWVAKLRYGVP